MRKIVGPIILIGVGAVALLVMTGHISSSEFWSWYGRWWPLLLIGWGIGLLLRRTPVEWLGGAVVAITFGIMGGGLLATGWSGFPVATGWAPAIPGGPTAPEPGAILLGMTDISTADGLDPPSLERALTPLKPSALMQTLVATQPAPTKDLGRG